MGLQKEKNMFKVWIESALQPNHPVAPYVAKT